jgi:ABC-type polysaccharide/polyol phosphate transport system ATPase subunit
MASLELDNVSLLFRLRQHRKVSFKEYLLKGLFRRSTNPVRTISALQNVSFKLKEGDRLGIIGHNGAGKSTLLKLLAGVYPPTNGRRIVDGQISSLFDLTLGFEPDASGWDNIAYRGYLQGETPDSLRDKMPAIAEFSELGEFLNSSVRYYSSGMLVRLAFSIATAIDPEILLVDEVLSAGDIAFQRKTRKRMMEMIDRARLIVMVSHDLESVRRICQRAVWMDHGVLKMDGPTDVVIDAYLRAMGEKPAAPVPKPATELRIAS